MNQSEPQSNVPSSIDAADDWTRYRPPARPRAAWVLLAVFAAWVGFLLWMAVRG